MENHSSRIKLKKTPALVRLERALKANRLALHMLENHISDTTISTAYFDKAIDTPSVELRAKLANNGNAQPKNKMHFLSLTLIPNGERVDIYNSTEPFGSNVGYVFDLTQNKPALSHTAPARILCVGHASLWSGENPQEKIDKILSYGLRSMFHIPEILNYFIKLQKQGISPEQAASEEKGGLQKGNLMLNALVSYMRRSGEFLKEMNEVVAAVSKEHCVGIAIPVTKNMNAPFFEHWATLKACYLALRNVGQNGTLQTPIVLYDNQSDAPGFAPLATTVDDVYKLLQQTEDRRNALEEKGMFFDGVKSSYLLHSSSKDFNTVVASLNSKIDRYYTDSPEAHHLKTVTEKMLYGGNQVDTEFPPFLFTRYLVTENRIGQSTDLLPY